MASPDPRRARRTGSCLWGEASMFCYNGPS